jgi:hypothetical protein
MGGGASRSVGENIMPGSGVAWAGGARDGAMDGDENTVAAAEPRAPLITKIVNRNGKRRI